MARRIGLVTAMHDAIEFEMDRNPRVMVMGVDAQLGVWGYGRGLVDRFGTDRVRNTPISEYVVTGAGAGAAMTGLRPIVDLCWANFMYAAWDQIADQLAKLTYMTNGQLRMPMVVIAGAGSCGNAGQHSDIPLPALVNLGSLTVVYSTTPEDAAGLMTSALRANDPVMFLYPGALSSELGEPFEVGKPIPFGVARVRRSGTDITCWASGAMVKRALEAASRVDLEGISVEVIDPRTLSPLDVDTVVESVQKTGRFVVVDETRASCSLASDIVAKVVSKAFRNLRCPPTMVTTPDNVTIPYAAVLEQALVPTVERIADSFHRAMNAA